LGHSFDLDQFILVDIKMIPGFVESGFKERFSLSWDLEFHVGVDDLSGDCLGCILVKEEMAGWSTVLVLHLKGIVLDQGVHKSIISLLGESLWDVSLVAFGTLELWNEVLKLAWGIFKLKLGPVVVQEAAEGTVWVSVFRHWTSDVWLWVFLGISLDLGPIIVQEAAESAIWVSIFWHWASDVWLWILLSIGLNLGPIIMKEAAEGAVRMGVLWHWSSNIRLWVLTGLHLGPVIVEEAGEGAVWVGILWHWASDIWLRILLLTGLKLGPIIVHVAAECAVWMSVFGHWTADIGLRILTKLNLSPVIVEVT